jgi:hypothetical protein
VSTEIYCRVHSLPLVQVLHSYGHIRQRHAFVERALSLAGVAAAKVGAPSAFAEGSCIGRSIRCGGADRSSKRSDVGAQP